jgi:hypothetical protein
MTSTVGSNQFLETSSSDKQRRRQSSILSGENS